VRASNREKIEWAKLARQARSSHSKAGSESVSSGTTNEDEDGFMIVTSDTRSAKGSSKGTASTDDWDNCATPHSSNGSAIDDDELRGRVQGAVEGSHAGRRARLNATGGGPYDGPASLLLPDQLSRAVLKGDCDAVVAALDMEGEESIDVNACDEYGNTLLILAAQAGSASTLDVLLRRGADINAQNWRGQTALHFAYAFLYHELADFLLARCFSPRKHPPLPFSLPVCLPSPLLPSLPAHAPGPRRFCAQHSTLRFRRHPYVSRIPTCRGHAQHNI
jgi:hypothetical protein